MNAHIDLTNCDREPIHIPGSVQPHGILLAIREADMRIVQVSENVQTILGKAPVELLSSPLHALIDGETLRDWHNHVLVKKLEGHAHYLTPLTIGERRFEGSIHRQDGALLLQLEPVLAEATRPRDVFAEARDLLSELQRARSVDEFSDLAARGVREQTGLDRVVIYQFLSDGSGEVIGESKRTDLTSWIGLRYPESDIPKQARALYLKSWLRIISDVNAVPARLTPSLNPMTGAPLDMTYCVLRSVSPIHIQYLKNMGVQTSMSLSLIHDGKLWGLIACHHETPKSIAQEARIACEFVAHAASLQIGMKEEHAHRGYVAKLRDDAEKLTRFLSADEPLAQCLLKHRPDVMSLFRASGAAVITDGALDLRGLTPSVEQINPLLSWLAHQPLAEGVFATDQLPELFPPAAGFQDVASGLLAIHTEQTDLQWILWFRQEVVQTVNWAGDPQKPMELDAANGLLTLSPRKSFALWQEEKRGRSEMWLAEELKTAAELRRAIVEVLLKRMQELKRANQDLLQSNSELDAFSYAASHDLKEPLRGIQLYSELVRKSIRDRASEEELRKLEVIIKSASRMDELIDSLLEFSRVGNLELEMREIDTQLLVEELTAMLKPQLEKQGLTIRIPRRLKHMRGDRVRMREVFQNLITNAAKYNDKPERWVEIGFVDGERSVFYVRDNGIGIAEEHQEVVFEIFRRLSGREEYGGGAGAGLTITKKIVERHGGRIWLESMPGQGTTFYFDVGPGH